MKTSLTLLRTLGLSLLLASPAMAEDKGHTGPNKGIDSVRRWNKIAIDASGLDHTPVAVGENRVFGEQLGPCRAARAMAIVHIAMFDTVSALGRKYTTYTHLKRPPGSISLQIAISQAAHDTLAAMFPSQTAAFDAQLADDLDEIKNRGLKRRSIKFGKAAAQAILTLRQTDGAEHPESLLGTNENEYATSDLPGHWRQDPISLIPLALGAHWHECKPFVMETGDQFRAPPPPAMDSAAYATAYNEAKNVGGDGVATTTQRTPDQTIAGIYWAYDGTPALCAPPRLYNQLALHIADQMHSSDLEVARLLTLLNVAMADAGLAVWDSKHYDDSWRPITAIREADAGAGDGNPATSGDPNWSPLGAPASNGHGPNFTPPFPAYPSGHAGFGGAVFEMLRNFYGQDDITFTFVSDELNGVTRGSDGNVRPLLPRTFTSLSQAEEENGQSRIYLGIHWSFDKTAGIAQGRQVADYVFEHAFRPRHGHDK